MRGWAGIAGNDGPLRDIPEKLRETRPSFHTEDACAVAYVLEETGWLVGWLV